MIGVPPNGLSAQVPSDVDSIVRQPPLNTGMSAGFGDGSYVLWLAQVADEIPPWGTYIIERDIKLREFWPTEPTLASAMFTTAAMYASFDWSLEGPTGLCNIVRSIIHNSEHGQGWNQLIIKTLLDYWSQDNGTFIEVIRTADSASAPVMQLNHLDAGRCRRTGRWDTPVIYWDMYGAMHLLKWYQVIEMTDMPSPIERMRGYGTCAVSRVLRQAQTAKDIGVYKREKVGGRWHKAIHLVSGVGQKMIEQTMQKQNIESDNQLVSRYSLPIILATTDPSAPVTHQQIDLASLPDNFNFDEEMRWYVIYLALAFGQDPQDYAPLPGGNLGSAQQSKVLAQKAHGKGPRLFMRNLEHLFNFHGIMPRTVTFSFDEQDLSEDTERTMLMWRRAQILSLLTTPGGKGMGQPGAPTQEPVLNATTARKLLVKWGDLPEDYLADYGEQKTGDDLVTSTGIQ